MGGPGLGKRAACQRPFNELLAEAGLESSPSWFTVLSLSHCTALHMCLFVMFTPVNRPLVSEGEADVPDTWGQDPWGDFFCASQIAMNEQAGLTQENILLDCAPC